MIWDLEFWVELFCCECVVEYVWGGNWCSGVRRWSFLVGKSDYENGDEFCVVMWFWVYFIGVMCWCGGVRVLWYWLLLCVVGIYWERFVVFFLECWYVGWIVCFFCGCWCMWMYCFLSRWLSLDFCWYLLCFWVVGWVVRIWWWCWWCCLYWVVFCCWVIWWCCDWCCVGIFWEFWMSDLVLVLWCV